MISAASQPLLADTPNCSVLVDHDGTSWSWASWMSSSVGHQASPSTIGLFTHRMSSRPFQNSPWYEYESRVQKSPSWIRKPGTRYSNAAQNFSSGESGMGQPSSTGLPAGVVNDSENSGSARKPPTSNEKRSLTCHSTCNSMPFCSALPPLKMPSTHQGSVSLASARSWISDHSMKNSEALNVSRLSSHWLLKPSS